MNQRIVNTIFAIFSTIFTVLFGAWDIALQTLIMFMILDYATGILRGIVRKELSSNTGFKGIARKSVILVILIVAVSLDKLLNTGNWVFRTLVCYFYIANEGISILENCCQIGIPIPEKLKEALVQLQQGNKKEIKKDK